MTSAVDITKVFWHLLKILDKVPIENVNKSIATKRLKINTCAMYNAFISWPNTWIECNGLTELIDTVWSIYQNQDDSEQKSLVYKGFNYIHQAGATDIDDILAALKI